MKTKVASDASISIAIDHSILTEIKRDPVVITLQLRLEAVGHKGKLKLRAQLLRPRLKRQKAAAAQDSSDAG
jgi:hypothetical protein